MIGIQTAKMDVSLKLSLSGSDTLHITELGGAHDVKFYDVLT